MSRRRFISAIAVGGIGSFVGCLLSNQESGGVRGEYTADPTAAQFDFECEEVELFEDTFRLGGTLTSLVIGSSTAKWHTDADRILKVAVYNTEPRSMD